MRFIIDRDIPFIKGVFEPFGDVIYAKGGDINAELVKDADALIIRTRTKCDQQLLGDSSIKIIATATIGTDHIDKEYCRERGIIVESAAGCNALAVMQHIFTAIYGCAERLNISLPTNSNGERVKIGVVGVGNVGSRVAMLGEYLGFEVLRNDPIKEREQTLAFNRGDLRLEDFKQFYSLDYLLENSDIITMHTYLDDVTRGFVNGDFLGKIKDGALFINSSRGEVVDEKALLEYKEKFDAIILDVWGNEPNISLPLLEATTLATPHIAGYSYEGKMNGTQMVVKAIANYFNIEQLMGFEIIPSEPNLNNLKLKDLNQDELNRYFQSIFPIFNEDKLLRENHSNFEQLRSDYIYRREFKVE